MLLPQVNTVMVIVILFVQDVTLMSPKDSFNVDIIVGLPHHMDNLLPLNVTTSLVSMIVGSSPIRPYHCIYSHGFTDPKEDEIKRALS